MKEPMGASYEQFLANKVKTDPSTGLADPLPALPAQLFPHQRDIVRWALKRGRAAIFAQTGLGKSFMELAWGSAIHTATAGNVLLLTPLAVAGQMVREAEKFGLAAKQCATQADVEPGLTVTNYEKLHHFDRTQFTAVILDESSILKAFDGKTRTMLIEWCKDIPYRLCATATPAPNDFTELGNHAEFLGVMSVTGMQATFFTHDGGDTSIWRLKGHAEEIFWEWMCSWSVLLRRPSDLGYPDDGYDLEPLHQVEHIVTVDGAPALTLGERLTARRESIGPRVDKAISIIAEEDAAGRSKPWVIWCNLNTEQDTLAEIFGDRCISIFGSLKDEEKEKRLKRWLAGEAPILLSKPRIIGFGLNLQLCADTIFVGLNDSFEQVYQAVRRFWRFGQTRPVTAHFIAASTEGAVLANLRRKEAEAERMGAAMVAQMADLSSDLVHGSTRQSEVYSPNVPMNLPDWLKETNE